MKRYISFILAAVLVLPALFSCKKEEAVSVPSGISGQWHLTSWNGKAPKGFDIYLELLSDGTFNLYQQTETSLYTHLTGNYTADGSTLSGTYSDGASWSASYDWSLGESDASLVLISLNVESLTSIYTRSDIPDSVRTPHFTKASGEGVERFL